MPEPAERNPYRTFLEAASDRRAARRQLRLYAQEVHDEERSTNAWHAPVARWEDCYDCACLFLGEARSVLGMPSRPVLPDSAS
jgi:hypothetical protein